MESWEILETLSALVDKSLVVYEEGADGQGRYRLLETVRQYGEGRLHEAEEAQVVAVRLFASAHALRTQTGQAMLTRVEQERTEQYHALKARLGASEFETEWQVGLLLSWETVMAVGLVAQEI